MDRVESNESTLLADPGLLQPEDEDVATGLLLPEFNLTRLLKASEIPGELEDEEEGNKLVLEVKEEDGEE